MATIKVVVPKGKDSNQLSIFLPFCPYCEPFSLRDDFLIFVSNFILWDNGVALDLPGGFMPGHGLSACWVLPFVSELMHQAAN